jgi:hypothetical protein|tara:strand:+ start:680 stop:1717 length:1038 start_codon:yes stop_codon:yes gene_type:complete
LRIVLLFLLFITVFEASASNDSLAYEKAYRSINGMLVDSVQPSFKKAVFDTENAFYGDTLNWDWYQKKINLIATTATSYASSNEKNFKYNKKDSNVILLHASLFKVLTDTFSMFSIRGEVALNEPYTYDFNDVFGKKDWANMFVSKLLTSKKGNCHSLSYLYKILSEELGVKSYISLAPLHMYIKIHSEEYGMYNTELTNVSFPMDAWIMSSGYIHTDAIRNSLYMDTLSVQESIAICLFDLAKGYQRKFGVREGSFMLKCCNTVLKYYPNHVSSLILKSKVLLHQQMNNKKVANVKEGEVLVDEKYVGVISTLHRLGYRKMPKEMYLRWMGTSDNNDQLKLFID